MSIKKQIEKIKQNWLLIAIFVLVLVMMRGNSLNMFNGAMSVYDYADESMAKISYGSSSYVRQDISYDGDFAPEVVERKITKTTNLYTEIKRGSFSEAQKELDTIIVSSGAYLLNNDVNKYGNGLDEYYTGYSQIKVDTDKYEAVISQLKDIGEVTSFSENARDITESYTDREIELAAEKERLKRYESMFAEAEDVSDKITLNDRIFDQERTIRYLEESIENMDNRVEYSTVYFRMTEKRSEYINIAVVKFSELVRSIVNSFNSLLIVLFSILPWLVAVLLGIGLVRFFRKR